MDRTVPNNIYTRQEILNRWNLMIKRCDLHLNSYEDCDVCDEWRDFDAFEKWFRDNLYGSKDFKLEIDKDLFRKGNKIYSPDTCCLIPKSLNLLLRTYKTKEEFEECLKPAKKKKYKFAIPDSSGYDYCDSVEEGYEKYCKYKKETFLIRANAYDFLLPKRIYEAIVNFNPM